jgi:hypothetical protein
MHIKFGREQGAAMLGMVKRLEHADYPVPA